MSFIANLEISTPPDAFANLFASASEDDTAMVGASQATGFAAGITFQSKQDVMNSTLLAQLAASAKYDHLTQADRWYDEYQAVLINLGWQQIEFKVERRELSDTPVSVDKIVLDYLKTSLDAAQQSLAARIIVALERSNDAAVKVFISSSTKGDRSKFQLGTSVEDGAKNCTSMDIKSYTTVLKPAFGAIHYSTSETITNPLFTKIKRGSAEFNYTFHKMLLNTEIYSRLRQAVIDRLGNNAKDLIHDLVLPLKN